MSRKVTFTLAGLIMLGMGLTPALASAEYRDLCDSARVCEYTGPNSPVLDADVCLDQTGEIRLKGSTPCATGAIPFHVRFGEVVNPVLELVVAYIPLKSACTVPGLCESKDYSSGVGTAQALCCVDGVCWPGVYGCQGTLLWCDDGVCNEDGTVTCFEGMEVP